MSRPATPAASYRLTPLTDEPPLEQVLCDRFGHWLDGELEALAERFAEFVTPQSRIRSLCQERPVTIESSEE